MKYVLIVVVCLILLRLLLRMRKGFRRPGGEVLVRDPVCGAYVPQESGLSCRVGAKTFYFCSPQCRKAFLENRP